MALFILVVLISQIASVRLASAQEGEVTLFPTDDTFVENFTPTSNFGNYSSLEAGKYEFPYSFDAEYTVWLKFNLFNVPAGAIVDVATLRLYSINVPGACNVLARSSSDNSWTESTLTYDTMPDINPTSMDSEVIVANLKWYNWTVTDAIQPAVDGAHYGSGMATIVLLETSPHTWEGTVSFYSKEGTDLYMPRLTVHWTDVVPELSSVAVLVLFMTVIWLGVTVSKRRTRALLYASFRTIERHSDLCSRQRC